MNLLKLIKNVRNLDIFNSLNGFTDQVKFKVKRLSNNLIVVDELSQEINVAIKNKILD